MFDEDSEQHDIDNFLCNAWHKVRGSEIQTPENHRRFVQGMRQKYVFPDYLDLVGPPQESHYIKSVEAFWRVERYSCLSVARVKELLLVGAFKWRNLTIGIHRTTFGFDRNYGTPEPLWTSETRGWYVAIDYSEAKVNPESFKGVISPFRFCSSMKLERFLMTQVRALKKTERVGFIDGNPFNCHPSNLELYSTIGRPMQCMGCGQRIRREQSVRIKVNGVSQRYCHEYLEFMEKTKDARPLKRCLRQF